MPPTITRFNDGLILKIFWREHNPPHVHAIHGEFDGEFDIETGRMLLGDLSKKDQKIVAKWVSQNSEDLRKAWDTQSISHLRRDTNA
jgi:hypothetical protein